MNRIADTRCAQAVTLLLLFLLSSSVTQAQTTAFTYQGKLTEAGQPANGTFDLQFVLFDTESGGAQQGATVMREDVAVTNGVFTVQLDFGANAFPGAARFLEISVRPGASTGAFTLLTPRQPVQATPYAVRALNAGQADNATTATNATSATNATNATTAATANNALQLGGVAANQYVLTNDARLSDARNPLAGSANYIQNTTNAQATSNFNISGNGTAGGTLSANSVNATTQFNLGGNRVLSVAGANNVFVGVGAGGANTMGTSNAFFGSAAGAANTTGGNNSYFGRRAGNANTTSSNNAFFGSDAGFANTGSENAFFGAFAGAANTSGLFNTFFGNEAGRANTTGVVNAFFGKSAGDANTTGDANSFFGTFAGSANTTGEDNAFFGRSAGVLSTLGNGNAFFGSFAGSGNTTGADNAFFGENAGNANTTGTKNTVIGDGANVIVNNLTNATALGAQAAVAQSNSLVLGSIDGVNFATANTRVGIGTAAPERILHLVGPGAQELMIESADAAGRKWTIQSSGDGGGGRFELVDRTAVANRFTILADGNVGIGTTAPDQKLSVNGNASKSAGGTTWAVFSDERLKNMRGKFTPGLQALLKLQPIRFEYKADNALGLKATGETVGFSAQAVAAVLPEAVTESASGYLQLNSDPILWTMLNAIKEQQAQISAQEQQIAGLQKLVCRQQPRAKACRTAR